MILKSLKYKLQNFSTYLMTWLFPQGRGKLFWKVYVYFRWVDDIIDDMSISQKFKKEFILEQKKKLNAIYSGRRPNMDYEEKGIYDVIKSFSNHKKKRELKKHIFNMMWTFDYDVKRVGNHIKEKEFMKYSKYIGGAYAFMLIHSYDPEDHFHRYDNECRKKFNAIPIKVGFDMAHFSHIAHIIRDYKDDIKKGYLNFPEHLDFFSFSNKLRKKTYPSYMDYMMDLSSIKVFPIKIFLFVYRIKFEKYLKPR